MKSACHRFYPPLPDDLWQVIANADSLIVFSLLPDEHGKPAGAEMFHGYPVLGKVEIAVGPDRAKVLEALHRGIYGESSVKRCWDPHHGARAVGRDRSVDLVLCFTCECM